MSIIALLVVAASAPQPANTHDAFFNRLAALCGKAYEGRIESPPVAADADFTGKRLVMHVRDCSDREIRIPFHVGEDRSRTWVITRTDAGLQLKHDHRHANGSPDALTLYGGHTSGDGEPGRQEFPADAETRSLFTAQNLPQSLPNVWAIEANDASFVYELARPGRLFRVAFDLGRPVDAPPPPWGVE